MSLLERIVVTNWKLQGGGYAAPVIMLCYYIGQEVFEEYMDKERWETYKETTRWGQLPIFTLEYKEGTLKEGNKKVFTNSVPTLRTLGKIWGYYFTELKQSYAYDIDMWLDVGADCMRCLYPTFKMDADDKLLRREELMSENGKLYSWFSKFDNELKEIMEDDKLKFLVNNTISIADFHFFATVNSIVCGWLDGIDKSFLKKFEHLNRWYEQFLEHYQERLASNPKKEEYPYIVHNGRFYVNGKDQTEFWANKKNQISKEEIDKMVFSGVDKNETHNISITEGDLKNLNLKKEELNQVNKKIKDEVLTRESTLGEVENAGVKLLKTTLKKHNKSFQGVTEKHELVKMVKEVLTNNMTVAQSV